MRAIGTWLVAIVATVCGAGVAFSADAYVVRYDTTRAAAPFPPCGALVYRDELIFQNAGAADAQVLLLGVSNGIAANPQALVVPAGKVRSSEGYCEGCSAASTWAPDPQPLLWVAHLDIPEQVKVISRLLVLAGSPEVCNGFPGTSAHTYAGIPMPVVRSLVPAGKPFTLLGTDIGGDATGSSDGRTNIGVFNAGVSSASATIEFRRSCDGALLTSRTTQIPANSVIQLNGLSNVFSGCSDLQTPPSGAYAIVTVDQPSFTYAVTLSNERLPLLPVNSSF